MAMTVLYKLAMHNMTHSAPNAVLYRYSHEYDPVGLSLAQAFQLYEKQYAALLEAEHQRFLAETWDQFDPHDVSPVCQG